MAIAQRHDQLVLWATDQAGVVARRALNLHSAGCSRELHRCRLEVFCRCSRFVRPIAALYLNAAAHLRSRDRVCTKGYCDSEHPVSIAKVDGEFCGHQIPRRYCLCLPEAS